MKLETTAAILTGALRTLSGVIERRNTIPILGTVLFDGNSVRGTDLDLDLSISIPATQAGGSIAIDHRSLYALARNIPGDETVVVEGDNSSATVSFSTGRYDLPSLPASDWPELVVGDTAVAEIDGDALRKALIFTSPFISTEETRYYLNGVCLDGEVAVATDGHRLGCVPTGSDFGSFDRPIIPAKAVRLLASLPAPKAISLATDRPGISIVTDGARLSAKLIDGTFPDWRRVVPANADKASKVTVDRVGFMKSMARIAAAMGATRPYVTLAFDAARLAVSGTRAGEMVAREYVSDVEIAGQGQIIAFQARYIADLLKVFASDRVTATITDPNSPTIWRGENGDAYAVLMPARIGDERLATETLQQWVSASFVGRAA